MMHCASYHYGTSSYGACSQVYDAICDVTQTIDTTFEMVFQVNFGDPLTIQYGPRISATSGFDYLQPTPEPGASAATATAIAALAALRTRVRASR
jgi:hypothetical protein